MAGVVNRCNGNGFVPASSWALDSVSDHKGVSPPPDAGTAPFPGETDLLLSGGRGGRSVFLALAVS